eukprot:6315236-Amphidinium_carterae.1
MVTCKQKIDSVPVTACVTILRAAGIALWLAPGGCLAGWVAGASGNQLVARAYCASKRQDDNDECNVP